MPTDSRPIDLIHYSLVPKRMVESSVIVLEKICLAGHAFQAQFSGERHHSLVKYRGDHRTNIFFDLRTKAPSPRMPFCLTSGSLWSIHSRSRKTTCCRQENLLILCQKHSTTRNLGLAWFDCWPVRSYITAICRKQTTQILLIVCACRFVQKRENLFALCNIVFRLFWEIVCICNIFPKGEVKSH